MKMDRSAHRAFRAQNNPRRRRFIQEYVKDLNATKAAERAGYSPKTANQQGPRLLVNVGVAQAVDEALTKQAERAQLTADEVIKGIRANIRRCESLEDYEPFAALKGWELLGRYLKMFTDKVEHSGTVSIASEMEEARQRVIAAEADAAKQNPK
jgi:phage terminase small subunit